jgi:hypothetical protein
MRKSFVAALGGPLLAAVLAFYGPASALAQTLPGPAVTANCPVLDQTCSTTDTTFTPTSVKVSVSSGGIMTVTCSGTTTNKPSKAVKCDGEKLGGSSGESPTGVLQPCSITLGSGSPVLTDDWQEIISPSGNVKVACKAGGNDSK